MYEFRIVKDGKVLCSVPLGETAEGQGASLDDGDIERLAQLYSIAANEKRLRMMSEIATRGEMRFSDFLQIALNPKLVSDSLEPMMKGGLVTHEGRGACYRPSERGTIIALTMTQGIATLLDMLEEETSEEAEYE
jgi:hypothetical protein